MNMKINFNLNGKNITLDTNPNRRLLDVLREDFDLTGPKEGCGEGECGACAVLLNGQIVNSCSVPLANVDGQDIMTIEAFSLSKQYQIIKDAFAEMGGVQCGFCTPGMIIATQSLLSENPHPSDYEIKIGLSGNLCRCTGYNLIIKAVKKAAEDGDGLW
ncbi:MAG: (2Fe-2S)-binding protein [Candidatus Izemoplasmatales bacterium]|uniref:(2Fe-2S)-binding protein n=1 Tax=Hujiaoplasma nucleasis TaxID=2725268 RepID=A0A7L6N2Q0_9MOLU|nr:(2Fe-2S)-binding protein [Hujiaoplasma nucleasis]QLY39507.1 (2Fe-2S)-binding protein [Hujiaoplasma nucleasis]